MNIVSLFPLGFGTEALGLNVTGFYGSDVLDATQPSALKQQRPQGTIIPNQWPCVIISPPTSGLLVEGVLLGKIISNTVSTTLLCIFVCLFAC